MKQSRDFQILACLIAIAMAFGGAGETFPLLEMLLELCGLATIGHFLLTRRSWAFNVETRLALTLLGLVLLLPLLQLIPLPPQLCQSIPGRETAVQLDRIMGSTLWRPWTMDVEGTIRSFLELLVPAAVLIGCMFLNLRERVRLLWLVIGFALFSGILGIAQLVTGGSLTPYPSTHSGYPIGLFVNRNHNAALLLVAIPLAGALAALQLQRGKPRLAVTFAAVSAFIVFGVVVLATTSRGGLLLLPLALGSGLLLLLRRQSARQVAGPALVTLGAAALVLVLNAGVTKTLTRFSSLQDDRLSYWHDIAWALQHYGLAGTGFGTFVPVFQSAESLESVGPLYINHAHNDFLELLLEGGIPAVLLLLAFLGLIGWAIVRSSRSSKSAERPLINLGTASGVLLLMLFSLVDFPLRMPALSVVFVLLCATLLPTRSTAHGANGRELAIVAKSRGTPQVIAGKVGIVVLLLAGCLLSAQAGVSASAIANGRYQQAAAIAPWATRAYERQATSELMRLNEKAAGSAEAAIKLSPINASAIRTIGFQRLEDGDAHSGNRLMELAASLGWRELLTQLWSIDAAERTREPVKAAQRAQGLFQQDIILPPLQLLLQAPDFEPMSRLLAATLAQRPGWRTKLLGSVGVLPAPSLTRLEEVLSQLAATPHPATTDEMKPVLQSLAAHNRTGEAQHLWLQLNPALIDNGEFNNRRQGEGLPSPDGWDVPSQNSEGVTVAIPDSRPGNPALRIGSTDWVTILGQDTMLPPGSYTLSYSAQEMGPAPVTLRWQLRCRGASQTQGAEAQLMPHQGWNSFAVGLIVPPRDCAIQRLALKRVEADNQSETWVDSVRIAPAGH